MSLINLNPAHDKAREELARLAPEEIAARAGVVYDPRQRELIVPFFNVNHLVSFPAGDIRTAEGDSEVSLTDRVCILHYLTHASGMPLTGRLVTFKELPNGSIYVGPFNNRAVRPLVSVFGDRPEKMVEAGLKMGGTRAEMGDWSVTVPVFPRVPITFVIWEGDEEFPPSGNILYDSSAPHQLETEDYALLPGLAIFRMKKLV
ncbi:MAG: DUF3786 domain-containing protein [Bacillota bacterium]